MILNAFLIRKSHYFANNMGVSFFRICLATLYRSYITISENARMQKPLFLKYHHIIRKYSNASLIATFFSGWHFSCLEFSNFDRL